MNKFADYVTSTAFAISLSKSMVSDLAKICDMSAGVGMRKFHMCNLMSISALERRGLVEHNGKTWMPTQAGLLMFELVKLAGLIDATQEQAA